MPNSLDKSMKNSIIETGHWSLLQDRHQHMDCGWGLVTDRYLSRVVVQSGDGVGRPLGSVIQLPFPTWSSSRDHMDLSFAQLRYLLFQGRICTAIRVLRVMMSVAFQFAGMVIRDWTLVFVSMSFSLNHRK